ncbi:MAG: OsmC family protein [Syntrophales bacterium]|jgi:organic hydroperoxide reductase OsmC/OhrA|nr:OsmC family protein [Syntrophales bacterium]MCU0553348.1 OsmC family protein [Syntrophales bacterium]MCU0583005.1 OsmC family protein [Syntrophales bacterium]
MMGTLATLMAGKKIPTPEHLYWADVEGDIEDAGGVLKITTIRVTMHLKCPEEKAADAKEAFANYITRCPAAQSVKDCIRLQDELIFEK